MTVRKISVTERRALMLCGHHLGGDAASPEAVARSLVALHATDPATPYLSVLARSSASTLAGVAAAMYDRKSLVRWMAMRRTLFVFPVEDVPIVQAAVSTPLAATLRKRLISQLNRNGSEPAIEGDLDIWLRTVEADVELELESRGAATGAQLGSAVPGLRTFIPPRAPSDLPQNVTSPLLTVMSAEGRLVRSVPTGAWTSRHHSWQPASAWWPDGIPQLEPGEAQRDLAQLWLRHFGPATVDDLRWWTGWNKTITSHALSTLELESVDLHGEAAIALAEVNEPVSDVAPAATLLPSLDPTPMGWRHRDWMFGIEQQLVFDRNGNIGPTLWWDAEIVGSWAIAANGEVRTRMIADRGVEAGVAVQLAAELLHQRLEGAIITPSIRTPLERSLVSK